MRLFFIFYYLSEIVFWYPKLEYICVNVKPYEWFFSIYRKTTTTTQFFLNNFFRASERNARHFIFFIVFLPDSSHWATSYGLASDWANKSEFSLHLLWLIHWINVSALATIPGNGGFSFFILKFYICNGRFQLNGCIL